MIGNISICKIDIVKYILNLTIITFILNYQNEMKIIRGKGMLFIQGKIYVHTTYTLHHPNLDNIIYKIWILFSINLNTLIKCRQNCPHFNW